MANNVLYIEDEPFIADLYAQVLRNEGYEVKISGDGVEGLKLAQTGQYDLVLLDLMLPGLSGMDVLQALRDPKQSPNFHAPVIILTNLGEDDMTKQEIEKLAQGYLMKASISPRQLVEYLKRFQAPAQPAN